MRGYQVSRSDLSSRITILFAEVVFSNSNDDIAQDMCVYLCSVQIVDEFTVGSFIRSLRDPGTQVLNNVLSSFYW